MSWPNEWFHKITGGAMHMHVYKLAGLYDMSTRVSYLLIRKALWQPYKHFLRKNKCIYVCMLCNCLHRCEYLPKFVRDLYILRFHQIPI